MGRLSLFCAADAGLLAVLWPTAQRAAGLLGHLDATVAERGADAALGSLAGGAIWLVAAWLAAGFLAAGVAALPGRLGRVGRCLAYRLLPRAVQRFIAGSAGLGVLLAPVAAVAAPTAPPGPAPATLSTPSLPTPGWPLDQPDRIPADPTPAWPLDQPATHARPPTPSPEVPPPAPRKPAEPAAGGRITVRPGDSLWLIAARRLGAAASPARVAAEWPRWYATNRAVIGPDPGLIQPGQVLHEPGASAGVES